MTQPAVTFQVKQLEEQFNTRLFERRRGGISLTPAGELVMGYAEKILALSDEMDTRVGELTGEVSGPLLLGASMTIAEFILPRILGEFKALHPQVQAQMTVANSEIIQRRVAELVIDVGLVESPSQLPNVVTEVCCDDELVVICAPGHKLAKSGNGGGSVTAQDVFAEPIISRESGSGTREFADHYFRDCGVVPEELNIVMELGSPEAIKGVVETGLGVGIMSRATVVKELRLGTLVALPLKPRLIRTLSVLTPQGKFRSRLVSAFVDFALARMRQMAESK